MSTESTTEGLGPGRLPSLAASMPSSALSVMAAASATCGGEMPNQPHPGNSRSVSITVSDPNLGEVERSFVLHLPAGYSPSGANDVRTALVLDFHGWGGDGAGQQFR